MESPGSAPRETTFLMTDVEGSTRLWENEPDAMSAALRFHDETIGDVVDRNGGLVVKSKGEGDSTFCVFEEPLAALRAAEGIQRALERHRWPTQSPIRVRIAVHQGPAEGREGDFFGPTVNRCARLRSVAHGGQIVVSEPVRAACEETHKFRDHGHHRLKDLLAPERVYELPWKEQEFPPLRSLNSLDHNLPVQLTSFIGREKESATVMECIDQYRLVTLTGVGGTGKTRLALHVSAEVVSRGDRSVRFVPFAEVKAGSSVVATVARALHEQSRPREYGLEAIVAHLGDRPWLLVFDNCEHVVSGAAEAAEEILTHCPNVRIVATSREALGLAGERSVPVEPLPLPPPVESHPVKLHEYDSVNLLLDRVRLRKPDFVLDAASSPNVSRLVRALDGIPLAIEQVAARVGALGLDAIVKRLSHRLDLLKSSDRFATPRQRTVRATLEWSHDLLDPNEKEIFAMLGSFQGVFLLDDANAVAGRDAMEEVESLANKSMLTMVPLSSHEFGFRMLETVREYARERVPMDRSDSFERHTRWAIKTAEVLDTQLDDTSSFDAFHTLDRVYEDLSSAVIRTIGSGDERALRFAFSLRKPWLRRGPISEGIEALETALSRSRSSDAALKADAHNTLGAFHMSLGHNDAALDHLATAATQFSHIGLPTKAAASWANMGILRATEGDFKSAKALFFQSKEAYEQGCDPIGAAKVSLNFGRMLLDSGHLSEARELFEHAIDVFTGHDPVRGAIARLNMAMCIEEGDVSARLNLVKDGLTTLMESNDQYNLTVGLVQIAAICAARAWTFEAAVLLTCAEACFAKTTVKPSMATETIHAALHSQIDGQISNDQRSLATVQARDLAGRDLYTFALSTINSLTETLA